METVEAPPRSRNSIIAPKQRRLSSLDLKKLKRASLVNEELPKSLDTKKQNEATIYNKYILSYETELDSMKGFNDYVNQVVKHKIDKIEQTVRNEEPIDEKKMKNFRFRRQSQKLSLLDSLDKVEELKSTDREESTNRLKGNAEGGLPRTETGLKNLLEIKRSPEPEEVDKSHIDWKVTQKKIFSALSKMNQKLKIQRPSRAEIFYRNNIKDFEKMETFINAKDFIKQSNPLSITLHDSNKYMRTLDALKKVQVFSKQYFSKYRKSRTVEGQILNKQGNSRKNSSEEEDLYEQSPNNKKSIMDETRGSRSKSTDYKWTHKSKKSIARLPFLQEKAEGEELMPNFIDKLQKTLPHFQCVDSTQLLKYEMKINGNDYLQEEREHDSRIEEILVKRENIHLFNQVEKTKHVRINEEATLKTILEMEKKVKNTILKGSYEEPEKNQSQEQIYREFMGKTNKIIKILNNASKKIFNKKIQTIWKSKKVDDINLEKPKVNGNKIVGLVKIKKSALSLSPTKYVDGEEKGSPTSTYLTGLENYKSNPNISDIIKTPPKLQNKYDTFSDFKPRDSQRSQCDNILPILSNEKLRIIKNDTGLSTTSRFFYNISENKRARETVHKLIDSIRSVEGVQGEHEKRFNSIKKNFSVAFDRTERKLDPILDCLKEFDTNPNYHLKVKLRNIGKNK